MQSTSLWRKLPVLTNPLISSASSQFAPFHSTAVSQAKSKSKDEGRGPNQSKAQIRFAVRQKRADTKKALKDFLLYGKPSKHFQEENLNWYADEIRSQNAKYKNSSNDSAKFSRSKGSGNSKPNTSSDSGKGKHSGRKPDSSKRGWQQKQRWYDTDDDRLKSKFEATFGGQRCHTWSFTWTENFDFKYSAAGFDRNDESNWEGGQRRVWSESDVEDEPPSDIGYHSQRVTLGLPPTGPLNLNDVKCAFRMSALRWHPDKHQGPSQAMAEEKFKLCVNAYNSLCNVLKPT